jgi:MoaA/NifB/PqqE/SkfB family radical SAM enzyme
MIPELYKECLDSNPNYLWIEPTNRCNARCIYCHHHYRNFGMDMSPEIYSKIRDNVLDDVKKVTLTGYGEPLIADIFDEMFQDCIDRKIQVGIITNGTLLQKTEILERLAKAGAIVCLSIDGACAQTYEKLRPGIKWNRMLDVLSRMKRVLEAHGEESGLIFNMNFVGMKQNIRELPDVIVLAHEYKVREVSVLPLQHEHYFDKVKGESLYDSPELVTRSYLKALELANRYGVILTVPYFFKEMFLQGKGSKGGLKIALSRLIGKARYAMIQLRKKGPFSFVKRLASSPAPKPKAGAIFCSMPWEASYFEASGIVYPCCAGDEKLGNLNDSTWDEIWNGIPYRNLRRTIHGWNPSALCRYCPLFFGINGGDANRYDNIFSGYRVIRLPLNSKGVMFEENFYPVEFKKDGSSSHVWMAKNGRIILPMIQNARFLRLITSPRFPMNKINPGMCRINGGEIEYFDNSCQNIHLPLEDVKGDRIELDIEMEHTFKVDGDPRDLSLVIMDMEYLISAE